MRCTEICTKDTLFIPRELPKIRKLLEIKIEISAKKYKYIDTPTGTKLLIEGIKTYNVFYSEDTKREQVVDRVYKIPFCSIIPINNNGCGYKSIEFVVEEFTVLEVNPSSIVPSLIFEIICNDNYKKKDIEIINSQVMEIKPSEGTLKYNKEENKKNTRNKQSYNNKNASFSQRDNNSQENNKLINYLIYNNIQAVKILLFLLLICVNINNKRLR